VAETSAVKASTLQRGEAIRACRAVALREGE